jgi:hypothetical protein
LRRLCSRSGPFYVPAELSAVVSGRIALTMQVQMSPEAICEINQKLFNRCLCTSGGVSWRASAGGRGSRA